MQRAAQEWETEQYPSEPALSSSAGDRGIHNEWENGNRALISRQLAWRHPAVLHYHQHPHLQGAGLALVVRVVLQRLHFERYIC